MIPTNTNNLRHRTATHCPVPMLYTNVADSSTVLQHTLNPGRMKKRTNCFQQVQTDWRRQVGVSKAVGASFRTRFYFRVLTPRHNVKWHPGIQTCTAVCVCAFTRFHLKVLVEKQKPAKLNRQTGLQLNEKIINNIQKHPVLYDGKVARSTK